MEQMPSNIYFPFPLMLCSPAVNTPNLAASGKTFPHQHALGLREMLSPMGSYVLTKPKATARAVWGSMQRAGLLSKR